MNAKVSVSVCYYAPEWVEPLDVDRPREVRSGSLITGRIFRLALLEMIRPVQQAVHQLHPNK
ncbi:MAG: hypothetical protein ACETWG_04400 [Candidatus Neomarinimicrobiota bacterium]